MITGEQIKDALDAAFAEEGARGAIEMLKVAKEVIDRIFAQANPWEVVKRHNNQWVLKNKITGDFHSYPSNGRPIVYKFEPNAIAATKRLNNT